VGELGPLGFERGFKKKPAGSPRGVFFSFCKAVFGKNPPFFKRRGENCVHQHGGLMREV